MSHEQAGAAVPNNNDTLPSPFSSEGAVIRQADGTTWIFYYSFNDSIYYEKKPKSGKATRHQLIIDGKAVIGSTTELAAALWQDSPRVYYIDRNLVLREAVLQGTSGDKWLKGALSNQDWKTSFKSILSSLGTQELQGEAGVHLRVFFNETTNQRQFTQATYTTAGKWEKAPF